MHVSKYKAFPNVHVWRPGIEATLRLVAALIAVCACATVLLQLYYNDGPTPAAFK